MLLSSLRQAQGGGRPAAELSFPVECRLTENRSQPVLIQQLLVDLLAGRERQRAIQQGIRCRPRPRSARREPDKTVDHETMAENLNWKSGEADGSRTSETILVGGPENTDSGSGRTTEDTG